MGFTIDRMRAYFCGGLGLTLCWLPSALGGKQLGAEIVASFIFGGLASFIALRIARKRKTSALTTTRVALGLAGLICARAHIVDLPGLLAGLALTVNFAFFYGWILDQKGFGLNSLTPPLIGEEKKLVLPPPLTGWEGVERPIRGLAHQQNAAPKNASATKQDAPPNP
jgi:hypothetical protein